MKGYCITCSYFKKIKDTVGYCTVLGITIEKDVIILDTVDTLLATNIIDKEKIYTPIIVHAYFCCPLYEDKNAKLQLQ